MTTTKIEARAVAAGNLIRDPHFPPPAPGERTRLLIVDRVGEVLDRPFPSTRIEGHAPGTSSRFADRLVRICRNRLLIDLLVDEETAPAEVLDRIVR